MLKTNYKPLLFLSTTHLLPFKQMPTPKATSAKVKMQAAHSTYYVKLPHPKNVCTYHNIHAKYDTTRSMIGKVLRLLKAPKNAQ